MKTIQKNDVIRIIPDVGPTRLVIVVHVEHHIITLTDHPNPAGYEEPS